MHLFAAFSLRNRALIALVTIVAAFFGAIAATALKQELIPSVQLPQLAVVSTYTGASPAVVSERVSRPIEQTIRGIEGLDSTSSTSTTGSSTVTADFAYGTNLDQAEQKIGAAINKIRSTLPDGVDPQVISGSLADLPVLAIAVSGDAPTDVLAARATASVTPELEKVAGVRAATLSGAPGDRITVTPKSALAKHHLTPDVIESTLKSSGVLVPAGSVRQGGSTRSIQVGTELGSTADIAALPLTGVTAAQYNGPLSTSTHIPTIGDVATVVSNHDPVTTVSLVNGRPALTISVTKLPAANTVEVSQAVRAELPKLRSVLGSGGSFTTVFDQAPYIEQSIQSLFTEGLLGLGFAVLVILVFLLSVRATLITAISIPTSVLLTLIGMQSVGYSLNILTLGAITIAIGRVVDDSIVVTENIARHFAEDFPGADGRIPPVERRAAILGAVKEVASAVTASTITTLAVFVPIAFVSGVAGELFRPFALTVTMALLGSLFVSLTIVPVLAYWFLRPKRARKGRSTAVRVPVLQRAYRPLLRGTLRHPWLTTMAALAVLVGTAFLVPLLQTNYLGSSGQNTLTVTETLPDGTSLDAQTVRARSTDAALRSVSGVRIVDASIGTSGSALRDAFSAGSGAKITYSVTTAAKADQDALQRAVRAKLKSLSGAGDFQVTASQGFGANSDIQVDITAGTASALDTAAQQVLDAVKPLPQVAQASSNLSATQPYLAVDIDAAKAAKAGYSEVALAQVVARASQPTSIGSITVGDNQLTVYLQDRNAPTTRADLAALKVATPTGDKRLDSLATIRTATEAAAITSTDAKRSAAISATPAGQDTGAASAAVSAAVAKLHLPAGTSASLGGVTSDQNSAFQQLLLALLAAILIVYTVMVATFRSLRQPLELLVSVPFAATGAIALQLISGIPLGVASFIGLVMLVGIVVTNAIVLIDLVNQYRERGARVHDAVLDGASRRLRPILMTALATIFALVPTATGVNGNSGFISQPLALVVIGGLVSSTLLTLIVLPTLYYLVEGRKERRDDRRSRRAEGTAVPAAPPVAAPEPAVAAR
ncbi:MAG TPA: efflux RND transporter permease subunit [Amnibacterium sp.]|jgi:HAE1 family hydrophobic/amphiphilic exporter-1|uniref:efflux RND transporter permease subunit n=1 Tax=Amnibacterium sp. TaxID=1872496 RepID=UPI002F91E0C9